MRVSIEESNSRGFIQSVPTNAVMYIQISDERLLKNPYLLRVYNQLSN